MNLITMTNITKVYNDGDMQFTALHPTEFYLNEGEFVAIIGPSGSGKTTFLTILGNLQEATSGAKDRYFNSIESSINTAREQGISTKGMKREKQNFALKNLDLYYRRLI